MSKATKSHIADLDRVIATLVAERNDLMREDAPTYRSTKKRTVTTVRYNNRVAYGERTNQILAHPDVPAKELAEMLGTHPRYVYKVRRWYQDDIAA